MIKGLFLEGAGWDSRNMCLVEAEPMQMVSAMPAIHFKPVERKKTNKSKSVRQQLLLLSCLTDVSTVRRHVRVSLLLLSCALGWGGPSIFCGQCGADVGSCESRPLDQERNCLAHESGPLRNFNLCIFYRYASDTILQKNESAKCSKTISKCNPPPKKKPVNVNKTLNVFCHL